MKKIILISILIVFGSLTDFSSQIENPESDAHGFDMRSIITADNTTAIIEGNEVVVYLEEVKETKSSLRADEFFNDDDIFGLYKGQIAEKKGDKEKKDTQEEPARIQTKIECVELILKKAVIETYYVNGQTEGLRIKGLDKISQSKVLQLKSGDIILALNGQTLNSKKKAYDIFKKARKEPVMTVDFLRDGETKQLLFDFQG